MRELSYAEAIREGLRQAMERDERVFILGEDIGVYGGAFGVTGDLVHQFGPERVLDTPISELGIAGAAIGAALAGMRPIAEIQFSDFITLSMEQLVNQAAKIHFMFGGKASVPMVLRAPGGSGTGAAAQHSQSLEAWFAGCPGMKVVAPASVADAYGMMKTAIRDDDPVLFCENLVMYNVTGTMPDDPDYTVPLGRAAVVREGRDLTLVAHSYTVQRALRVADTMSRDGIEIEVVDLRSLRPLDAETVAESVRKTSRALIAEEGWSTYGVGAELAARIHRLCFDDLDAPVERVGGAEVPMPYSKPLELAALPLESKIEAAARGLLAESGIA